MTLAAAGIPALPPSVRPFVTNDLDEVRRFAGRIDGEHSRSADGRGPLGYRRAALGDDRAALVWTRARLTQTIRGAFRYPYLHVPLEQGSTYVFGHRRQDLLPGQVMFVAPGWEHTRRNAPGAQFVFSVDGAELAAEIRSRRIGAPDAWAWRSGAMSPAPLALGSAWGALALALAAPNDPRRRAFCEAGAIAALAESLLRGCAVADARPLTPARLAAVQDWIDAHLAEPITLGQLCRVAGVGERCLQLAFQSQRGISPMRYVLERRLAAAHRRLRRAAPGEDVTQAAIDAGFSHLGRFAALYRGAYGESPSQTLRAAAQAPR
ncbi:MAG: helix-turn-helix domain-containing protein [Betaproteobacteria bacterium]